MHDFLLGEELVSMLVVAAVVFESWDVFIAIFENDHSQIWLALD